jgi:uncharacterized protein YjbI with pentapeptide repeats
MPITYDDIKHKLQPPLDCSEIKDLRGRYFHNRLITNYENTDFTGCVLFHCYPSGILNALEINTAQSESDLTLKGANLFDADLTDADLIGADLRGANLRWANLYGANLKGANLRRANLEGANLSGADLEGAYLFEANLQEADLEWANLRGANLKGAALTEANLFEATLEGAAYNSETCFDGSSITIEQEDSMVFVEDED